MFNAQRVTERFLPRGQDVGFTNAVAALVNFREWTQKAYPLVKE